MVGFESQVANLEAETNPTLGSPGRLRRSQTELGSGECSSESEGQWRGRFLPAYTKRKNKQERDSAGSKHLLCQLPHRSLCVSIGHDLHKGTHREAGGRDVWAVRRRSIQEEQFQGRGTAAGGGGRLTALAETCQ